MACANLLMSGWKSRLALHRTIAHGRARKKRASKYQMIAEHPGFTRFDTFIGSAYCRFTLNEATAIDSLHHREPG
jgi:hypothetical protein